MIDYLMQQLSKEMNISPPLKPEKPGIYVMPFENFALNISAMPMQGVMLSADLGIFPSDREEEFFEGALAANLFCQGTKGAVLGLSQDASNVTLTHVIEHRLDYREFRDIVEDFLNTADSWYEEAHTRKS
jgi:hypothetical protein